MANQTVQCNCNDGQTSSSDVSLNGKQILNETLKSSSLHKFPLALQNMSQSEGPAQPQKKGKVATFSLITPRPGERVRYEVCLPIIGVPYVLSFPPHTLYCKL